MIPSELAHKNRIPDCSNMFQHKDQLRQKKQGRFPFLGSRKGMFQNPELLPQHGQILLNKGGVPGVEIKDGSVWHPISSLEQTAFDQVVFREFVKQLVDVDFLLTFLQLVFYIGTVFEHGVRIHIVGQVVV